MHLVFFGVINALDTGPLRRTRPGWPVGVGAVCSLLAAIRQLACAVQLVELIVALNV
jgi:hypothetical protein